MVHVPGFFKDYALLADTTPIQDGTEKIAKGCVGLKRKCLVSGLRHHHVRAWENMKLQILQKISEAGTVPESTWRKVSAFKQNEFPKMIDKEDTCHYGIYTRRQHEKGEQS